VQFKCTEKRRVIIALWQCYMKTNRRQKLAHDFYKMCEIFSFQEKKRTLTEPSLAAVRKRLRTWSVSELYSLQIAQTTHSDSETSSPWPVTLCWNLGELSGTGNVFTGKCPDGMSRDFFLGQECADSFLSGGWIFQGWGNFSYG